MITGDREHVHGSEPYVKSEIRNDSVPSGRRS
jgi:hypothetical protein